MLPHIIITVYVKMAAHECFYMYAHVVYEFRMYVKYFILMICLVKVTIPNYFMLIILIR